MAAVLLVAVAALCSWHYQDAGPRAGLDPSWQAALHLAARHGVPFGTRAVFTYGPLGFLGFPTLWYTPTAVLALLFVGAVHLAFCATVFLVARQRLGLPASALVAFLVGAITGVETPELALLLVAMWLLIGVQSEGRYGLARWAAAACGGLAAALLLIKINTGLTALLMLVAAVWWLPPHRWRAIGHAAAAGTLTFTVGWFATGNSVGNLADYLHNAKEITTGYTHAMWTRNPTLTWQIPVALALGGATLVVAALLVRRHRVVVLAIAAVLLYSEFKHAFVRHEEARAIAAFVAAALVAAVLPWNHEARRWARGLALLVIVAGLCVPLVEFGAHEIDPVGLSRRAVRSAVDIGFRRPEVLARARARIRARTGFDGEAEAALAGHTVHIEPYEASIAWLLQGRATWRPAPVFQTYSAYTPDLDRLNARFVAGASAPTRILWLKRSLTIDGRDPDFEAPAYMVAMLCHYRVELDTPAYEVLAHVPNRCGGPHRFASTTIARARPLQVPPAPSPGDTVLARITVEPTLAEQLRSAAFRPSRLPTVIVDGTPYRLIVATAPDGLLLRVPPGTRPVPGFDRPLDHQMLVFDNIPGTARVDFYSMPVRS